MCNFNDVIVKEEKVTGYKVVCLMRDGKFRSPATGCEYKAGKNIPIIMKQKRLSKYFVSDILDSFLFIKRMKGRTAIFINFDDACCLKDDINDCSKECSVNKIVIIKMTISGKLISGTYNNNSVVAGTFIERMNKRPTRRKVV